MCVSHRRIYKRFVSNTADYIVRNAAIAPYELAQPASAAHCRARSVAVVLRGGGGFLLPGRTTDTTTGGTGSTRSVRRDTRSQRIRGRDGGQPIHRAPPPAVPGAAPFRPARRPTAPPTTVSPPPRVAPTPHRRLVLSP